MKVSLTRISQIKVTKLRLIAGAVSLVLAGLVLTVPTMYYRWQADAAAPARIPASLLNRNKDINNGTRDTVSGKPVRLLIPSLSLALPVIPGEYNTNTKAWTLSLDKVQFATISAYPNNDSGLTYLYGHYRWGVFATLHNMAIGEKAIVVTENGYRFTYVLHDVKETKPNDISAFIYDGPPKLIIQTCSGAWFQKRQQFSFTLQSYAKIKPAKK